ncbi:type II toxin-antitoxin system VapC family toxin [Candidatus Manganitrophus noduliformans]|uniref:Ribonuclease VapC n=1 Tax=Candidatus Manganitrophus noduliformans TaxID=2606439 RepID=A0A7X6IDU3_9BACT|nr:type II toxin-antitoxin system VapC family toxin [Candidatus Manganitrophus noduliformans]NKE73629.1 type II toxin-antitoxin system VapC family toxin [Candidatus Manganitrophus noduliformans]
MNAVCVDASFALKLVIPEPESEDVAAMWEEWQTTGRNVVSPWLFAFEVLAVLRRKVFRKELSSTEGRRAWEILSDLAIELRHHDALWIKAWELASKYDRPTTYDTAYLALAHLVKCELWTADRRLVNAVGRKDTRIRLIESR